MKEHADTARKRPNKDDRLLIFAPHPDDESLMAGGLVQRTLSCGGEVAVVFVSDGDNNPWVQRIAEHRLILGRDHRKRLGEQRRKEAYAALADLGVKASCATFLGLPDRMITDILLNRCELLMSPIEESLARVDPTIIVTPSLADVHPDHNAVALAVTLALARSAASRSQPLVLRSMIHGRTQRTAERDTWGMTLTPGEQARKRRALFRHHSQAAVWRRRFVTFADSMETFSIGDVSTLTRDRPQPRLALSVAEEGRRRFLELRLQRRSLGFGSSRFFFVEMRADGSLVRLAIRPRSLAGRGLQESLDHGRRVCRFPAHRLGRCEPLFVKRERSFGLFDSVGWSRARHSTSKLPVRILNGTGLYAVIPCYNVAHLCAEVIEETVHRVDRVIVVDDGSTDGTRKVLQRAAARHPDRIRLLLFDHNRGKGASLHAAFRSALADRNCSVIVTLDGDGQHRPADIPALLAAVGRGTDLAVGIRSAFGDMPLRSRFGNLMSGWFLRLCFPGCPSDTQSGFRAVSRSFAETVVRDIHGGRYESELLMLLCALERGWKLDTVAIPTVYKDGNRSSHFRPLADSLRIVAAGLRWIVHERTRVPAKRTSVQETDTPAIEQERSVA